MVYRKKKSKTLRKNKRHQKRRQRKSFRIKNNKLGGIGIVGSPGDPVTSFNNFINNSIVSLLNNTSQYGLIFTLHNNIDEFPGNYYSLRSSTLMNKVKYLILKMAFISSTQIELVNNRFRSKLTITEDQFIDEVNSQVYIYNESKVHFEPICPSIVNGLILDNEESINYINNMLRPKSINDQTTIILNQILFFLRSYRNLNIGLVSMEMMENTVGLYSLHNDVQKLRYAKLMCLYEHYRLYNLGYFHGDFHLGNCLFEPNTYYIPTNDTPNGKGRVSLIDFGASFRHNILISSQGPTLTEFVHLLLNNTSPNWHHINPNLNLTYEGYQWVREFINNRYGIPENIFYIIDLDREFVAHEEMMKLRNRGINTNIRSHLTYNLMIGGNIRIMPQELHEEMPQVTLQKISKEMPQVTPQKISKETSQEMYKKIPEELKTSISEKINEVYNNEYLDNIVKQLEIMNTTIPELYEKEEKIQNQILSNITNNR